MKSVVKKYLTVIVSLLLIFVLCSCNLNYNYDENGASSSTILSEATEIVKLSLPTLTVDIQPSAEKITEGPTSPTPNVFGEKGEAEPVNPNDLPAYSGNSYTIVNNNQPIFSEAELTTVAYERYSNLDSLGRCGIAIASCGKEIMPGLNEERGSISSIKPSGWKQASYKGVSGGYLWNRCHLIGWQLSAENANRQNLITGTRYMNVDGMLIFENMVADYIKETNNHVAYRITPIFIGNNLVCSGVQMEAYSIEDSGEGICFNVYCYNVQPGIAINYLTGDSGAITNEEAVPSATATATATPALTIKPTAEPTKTPTVKPTITQATPTPGNTEDSEVVVTVVWIPKTGKKFHSYAGCSNMKNPSQVTKQEAINRGYGACSKCW